MRKESSPQIRVVGAAVIMKDLQKENEFQNNTWSLGPGTQLPPE